MLLQVFVEQIFRIFDKDGNGSIDFKVVPSNFKNTGSARNLCWRPTWQHLDPLKKSFDGRSKCTTRMVQVRNIVQCAKPFCPKKKIMLSFHYLFNWFMFSRTIKQLFYWTGSIELKEMTEIIGTLYQMEGVAKVQGCVNNPKNHIIINSQLEVLKILFGKSLNHVIIWWFKDPIWKIQKIIS